MKVSISTLFFFEEDLSRQFLRALTPSLHRFLEGEGTRSLELLVTNNAPGDLEPLLAEFRALVPTTRFDLKVQQNIFNHGFGRAHNEALARATGDVFIVLNNDLFFDDEGWIEKIILPLATPAIGLSGLRSSHSALGDDGLGRPPLSPDSAPEYLEASALAVRAADARSYGLFSYDYPYAYQEDADLSLRFRSLGFRLEASPIAHRHLGSASTRRIPREALASLREWNQHRFRRKWGAYLRDRRFFQKALLRLAPDDERLGVAALPALASTLREHPHASIEVVGRSPLLETLLQNHPRVKFVARASTEGAYDTVIDLENFVGLSGEALPVEISQNANLAWTRDLSELFAFSGTTRNAVLLAAFPTLPDQGRNPPESVVQACLRKLSTRAEVVIWLGDGPPPVEIPDRVRFLSTSDLRTPQDWLALYSQARAFIGNDSAYLQLAQLFGIPSFAVLGDTCAEAALLPDLPNAYVTATGLDCLGCATEKLRNQPTFCWRTDEACMKTLEISRLDRALTTFLELPLGAQDESVRLTNSVRRARKLSSQQDAAAYDLAALRRKNRELEVRLDSCEPRLAVLEREHGRFMYRLTRTTVRIVDGLGLRFLANLIVRLFAPKPKTTQEERDVKTS